MNFASEVKGDKELRRMPCCTKQHQKTAVLTPQ